MNPKAVKIAKACGWIFHEGSINGSTTVQRKAGGWYTTEDIPDYLHDQNAMYEAERVLHLDEVLWRRYRDNLLEIYYVANDTFSPSAYQRAEAFIKTIEH